jgi:hypothetical protein
MRPASLFFLCLGATDDGWTGTLGAVVELQRTAEVSGRRDSVNGDRGGGNLLLLAPQGGGSRQECSTFVVGVLRCGLWIVGWWRSDGLEAREIVGDDAVLSMYVSDIGCELGYEIEMVALPQ